MITIKPSSCIFFLIAGLLAISVFFSCHPAQRLTDGEGYIPFENGKLWYRVIGEGQETPLMMLHGGPGGTTRSFYLLSPLSEDIPVILFDQLGSGRSGYHEDTTLLKVELFVEQVEAVRKELGLKSFYLLGHSWGSALALEYYLAYPEAVKGLIFSSPYVSTPVWERDADTLIMMLPDSVRSWIAEAERTGEFDAEDYQKANTIFMKNFWRRGETLSSPLDTAKAPFNAFIYNYMWGPTEFTARGTLKKYDRFEDLRKVEVPTLFMTGEYDEARPATVKRMQALVPGAEFEVIDGAGHSSMHDNLPQSIQVIRDFILEHEKQ